MTMQYTPILTAYFFVLKTHLKVELENVLLSCKENGITVKVFEPNDRLPNINPKTPRVYISLGNSWNEFPTLSALPLHERKRWLHFQSSEDIQPQKLFYCWLKFTDPLLDKTNVPTNRFTSETPLVSIFTASYKSKDKILRPYRSLLKQTYSNWEWVIVDDSSDEDE